MKLLSYEILFSGKGSFATETGEVLHRLLTITDWNEQNGISLLINLKVGLEGLLRITFRWEVWKFFLLSIAKLLLACHGGLRAAKFKKLHCKADRAILNVELTHNNDVIWKQFSVETKWFLDIKKDYSLDSSYIYIKDYMFTSILQFKTTLVRFWLGSLQALHVALPSLKNEIV